MKRFLCILMTTLLLSVSAQAADYTVQSKLLDKKNDAPIEMGTVRLLAEKDSSLIVGTLTDGEGRFRFNKVSPGNYILECRYLGYDDCFLNISVKDRSLLLKNIYMEEKSELLEAAQVSGTAAQMIVKVDTIEFNAVAFKTAENAVVEDLLKRLPGVEVKDGSITVNGENISRIKVDGKKFFDGDMEMTTKNLTADMIDKIQIVDEKSDMAKLTGFEDENTERIINLTLKPNRRKGVFGNVSGAGGADMENGFHYNAGNFFQDDFRYNANTFINLMLGESQTALVAGANNTNNSRSGRGRGSRGWGSGGITETQNIGINNNTQIKKGLIIGGDGSYNHSSNLTETETSKDSWLKTDTMSNHNISSAHSQSDNANIRLEMEWQIDTLNTLIVQPNISYGRNTSQRNQTYDYYTNGDSSSWGSSRNNSMSHSINSRINMIYSHKSKQKPGRSITLNLGGDYGENNSEGFNFSDKYTFEDTIHLDQKTLNNSNSYGFNFRTSYVEPLWNLKNFLEATVSVQYSERHSEKEQFNKNGDEYNDKDLEYSNSYKNLYYTEVAEIKYRYVNNEFNLMAGVRAQPSQTFSYTTYGTGEDYNISQSVVNFSPTMTLRYNMGERRNFVRMEYRGNTQQPSISQMQPVKDNSDLMNETVGNPGLIPSYSQSLRLIVSKFYPESLSSWNASFSGSMTQNALVSNSIYDNTGKQYNQTVNADRNPYQLNGSFMFNTPLVKNRLHFNTNTSVRYQERIGYSSKNVHNTDIDITNLKLGDRSQTINYGFNENMSLAFTHDIIEIGLRGSFSYANTNNNLNANNAQQIMNWSGSGDVNLHLPYSINISSDISYGNRSGYANFDKQEILWNASIDKTIKNKWTLSFSATDILRQRLNINQNIGDNYVSYNRYNTLPSYFMLTVTYKIAKFKGSQSNYDMMGGGQRGGYPRNGGGNRGGGYTGGGAMRGGVPPMGM